MFLNIFCKIQLVIEAFLTCLHSVLQDLDFSPYCTPALGNERQWCVKDLIQPDLRPSSPILATVSPGHQTTKKESHTLNIPISSMTTSNNYAKKSKCTAKKALAKYSSNIEVTVILTVKTIKLIKKAWM